MIQKLVSIVVLVLVFVTVNVSYAQESSKTKSASKLYERGEKVILVNNAARINTKGLETSPCYYNNGLLFVGEKKSGPIDRKTGMRYFDLYYAEIDKNYNPLSPDRFSQFISSPFNEGASCFSNDENVLYFTSNNQQNGVAKSNKKSGIVLKIFQAQRGQDDWVNIQELPFCSDDFNTAHPSLSADGTKLYFASDRPGGFGGMDLYVSEKIGDRWSAPKNLGSKINTAGKELFPFIYGNDILFFSSTGHNGPGGLDILFSDLSDAENFTPVLLDEPINSVKDDVGFIMENNGQRGFFASNRASGNGSDDIYSFEVQGGSLLNKVNMDVVLNITTIDNANNQILPGTAVYVLKADKSGNILDEGFYDVEFIKENATTTQIQLARKKTLELGEPAGFTNDNGQINLTLEPNQNYAFFFKKQAYDIQEHFYLTGTKPGTQNIRIPLSLKDCATVSGIVTNQKTGAPIPFAEIKITKSCTGEVIPMTADGEGRFEMCLPQTCSATFRAEKNGYIQGLINLTNPKGNLNPLKAEVKLLPFDNTQVNKIESSGTGLIAEGSVIVLENIYYDYNKALIRPGAAKELDALFRLMNQFPTINIELLSHTDSRGDATYNQELSTQRAYSAKNYLVARGIDDSRIKATGMGESQLRNKCADGVDCTEEEHQYNRRTEVKITSISTPVEIKYGSKGPEVIDAKKTKDSSR